MSDPLLGDAPLDWGATPFLNPVLLGRGAMGAVFRAWDPRSGREVALKVLRAPSAAARERFLREGQLAAGLRHTNVVRVHEFLRLGAVDVLVCEVLEGARPLDEAWRDLELRARVRLLRDAAAGVAAAHGAGIVHRDLKPDNVLVDALGCVRVSDFGVAYSETLERLTRTGAVTGTPAFMSPEQLTGERQVAPTLDVWALGVLLYLALQDELPFKGHSYVEQVALAAGGLSRRARRSLRETSPALGELVQRSLQRDPEARPASGVEFLHELDAWLSAGDPQDKRWAALLGFGVAVLLGSGGAWLALPRPQPEPIPASSPAPGGPAPHAAGSRAPREVDSPSPLLADSDPLVRYLAAAALVRASPPDPKRAQALRVLAEGGGSQLARIPLESGAGWRGFLTPSGEVLAVDAAGRAALWSRSGGTRPLPQLPRGSGRHSRVDPLSGGVFVLGAGDPRPGVGVLNWDGSWRWEVPPDHEPIRAVTAATRLANGRLAWGGPTYLELGQTTSVPPRPGLFLQAIVPWRDGALGLWTPIETRGVALDSLSHLVYHDPARGESRLLTDVPGHNATVIPDSRDETFLLVNIHYAKVSRHGPDGGERVAVFSPTLGAGPLGSLECRWGPPGQVLVLFRARGAQIEARWESWDATRPGIRRWSRSIGAAQTLTPAGAGPDCAIVGYPDHLRVYGLPLEFRESREAPESR